MKLNDFKKLDEAQMLGNYGSALMKNMGNKMRGSGMGAMSTVDQMTKDNYINNFLGAASSSLNSAIQGDLVDPNAASTATPSPTPQPEPGGNNPPTTAPVAGGNTPPTTPGAPKTPDQIRQEKLAANAAAAQKQMAANPAVAKPSAPVAPAAPKTPAQIRQEKQAAATQNAQANMAPVSKLPANQPQVQAANIRQQKQTAATNTAQANMAPYSKVKTAPAVWKNNRNPAASAKRSPKMAESTTFDKLNYIFESILLEADNSISSFMQKFFTKHLRGLDTSASQAKIKELADLVQQTYSKDNGKAAMIKMANLAYALEHVGGGGAGAATSSTKPLTPAQAMAKGFDGASATNKGTAASQASTDATAKAEVPGQPTTNATASQEEPASGASQPAADPQKEKTVYTQVKGMLDKLDKKGKQRILAALEKQLGTTRAPASTTSAPASNSPFGQMASQLTQPGATDTSKVGNATKSSTGGKTQQTTTGTVHSKSRNNPNINRRTSKVAPVQATEPTPATPPTEPTKQWKGRKTKAPAVAESKRIIKVWGQK